MANENEAAKELLPYLQRADELHIHQPLVSYYCRLYAMERGIKIPKSQRTTTTNALLVSLIKLLEKDKKSMKLGPDDNLHLEGFALGVFAKADKQDRAGRADMSTAKTFYASSIFFEILNQFGELQPDLEEKQKYAAWKAADIRKALKEGRKPVPGPSTVEKEQNISRKVEQNDRGTIRTDLGMGPAPGSDGSSEPVDKVDHRDFSNNLRSRNPTDKYPSHNYDQSPSHYDSSHSATSVPNTKNGQADSSGRNRIVIETSTTSSSQAFELYDSNYQPPSEKIAEAHKAARFALGALSFDDVSIAVD